MERTVQTPDGRTPAVEQAVLQKGVPEVHAWLSGYLSA
jgi:hypothetical protein